MTDSVGAKPLVRFRGVEITEPAKRAFDKGDRRQLVRELSHGLGLDLNTLDPAALVLAERLAELAIEVRRQEVAVIGQHDAFVRKTKDGSLLQVIRPVRLSLSEKTIWQLRAWRPMDNDGNVVNTKTYKGQVTWGEAILDPGRAGITYSGLLKLNSVAGCAVGQPPTVNVDGETKTNPYVQRVTRPNGRLGDIIRVVINVAVVGPAPATGNPVVVNYTLDYDPGKDFAHMLATVGEKYPECCYLAPEPEELSHGWSWHPIYGEIGFLFDLRSPEIFKSYTKFIKMQSDAVKKAQTVARRNAMKAHPALAIHDVVIGKGDHAVVGVVGWAGDQGAMDRWTRLQDRLSRGQALDDDLDIHVINLEPEEYEPTVHNEASAAELAEAGSQNGNSDEETATSKERNELLEYIDAGIGVLSPAKVRGLAYDPSKNTIEELRAIRSRIDQLTSEM